MKQWKIKQSDITLIDELSAKTGYSKIVISILLQKGISTPKLIEKFIHPRISDLHNPFLFADMEKAVNRIRLAIDKKEKILIYGDRDVDGITSTNIAYLYLKDLGADVMWYIPSDEGYGLHNELIEKYKKEGVGLIITVDCGITAVEEVNFATSQGIDVIITDHHEAPSKLPKAFAIIDPKCPNELYPFKELAGVGVAFKLFQAVAFSYSDYFAKDIVVLDIETTGLSPLMDEIVEIGAVKIRNFIEIEKFTALVKPKCSIPKNVSAIHGITDDDCKFSPDISEVMKKFLNFIGESILVAHNSNFDMAFLYRAAKKIKKEIPNVVIDTLELSRKLYPFKSHGLDALAKDMDIEISQYHRALSDAATASKVFERLVIFTEKKQRKFIEEYLYLVSLGTVADIVPLVSENRIFVKYGVPLLYNSKKPGICAMIDNLLIEKKSFTAKKVSWSIVPLLNSAGRYGKAALSAELLITDDKARAALLLDEILEINGERKGLQKINIKSFIDETVKQNDIENDKIFITVVDNLKHGVTGIAANQIIREFGKPVILLILENDEAMGAARSIKGFDIVSAIEKCKDIVVKYGGHKAAAGLTVAKKDLEEFIKRIKFVANSLITDEMLVPHLSIDTTISVSDISVDLIKELELLEPYGFGNEHPIFIANDIVLGDFSSVGIDGAHLRARFKNDKMGVGGIGWQLGRRAADFRKGQKVDVVFHLEINVWQSRESAQIMILDIKSSDVLS
ncbi:MAG: single-stranded-DNA-specific exonuclease RecJ [Elusimicrobiota bacterium]